MTDTYTLQLLHEAQAKITGLVESKSPSSQEYEFYDTMLQTMYALDMAMREMTGIRRGFNILSTRVEILEKLLTIKFQDGVDDGK